MPIYEYRRPDGSTFEIVQSFSDDPLTHDPDTGVPVQRVLHAPAVHFKGSGFYHTDYGTRKRQRESASTEEPSAGQASRDGAATGADGGEESKGESKGQSTGESKGESKGGQSANGSKPKDAKPVAAKS
jgi:putative FmdB family regulatory protein